jgi:hypothetical protein
MHQGLRLVAGAAGDYLDALGRKEAKSPLSHAPGEDEIHPQVPQPTRQDSRFMRRRGMEFLAVDQSRLDPDHGELLAMAEMITQPSLSQRDGHFKGVIV